MKNASVQARASSSAFQGHTAVAIDGLPHRVNTCPDAVNADEWIAHLALWLLRPLGLVQPRPLELGDPARQVSSHSPAPRLLARP